MNTVRLIPISEIPENVNVIRSHVLYKVKDCDDGTKLLKARIAPHGNEDSEKDGLKTDSATCPPVGIRIVCSTATVKKWPVVKIDFKTSFLQTGSATRDVYMIPPRECFPRTRHYWLLLAAAYGLVNSNAKWQAHSDTCLTQLGFQQLKYVPQLFFVRDESDLRALAVKIVDDILF